MHIAERRSMMFNLQDLKCAKCGHVSGDNMSTYCACSGRLVTVESPAALEQRCVCTGGRADTRVVPPTRVVAACWLCSA